MNLIINIKFQNLTTLKSPYNIGNGPPAVDMLGGHLGHWNNNCCFCRFSPNQSATQQYRFKFTQKVYTRSFVADN